MVILTSSHFLWTLITGSCVWTPESVHDASIKASALLVNLLFKINALQAKPLLPIDITEPVLSRLCLQPMHNISIKSKRRHSPLWMSSGIEHLSRSDMLAVVSNFAVQLGEGVCWSHEKLCFGCSYRRDWFICMIHASTSIYIRVHLNVSDRDHRPQN